MPAVELCVCALSVLFYMTSTNTDTISTTTNPISSTCWLALVLLPSHLFAKPCDQSLSIHLGVIIASCGDATVGL